MNETQSVFSIEERTEINSMVQSAINNIDINYFSSGAELRIVTSGTTKSIRLTNNDTKAQDAIPSTGTVRMLILESVEAAIGKMILDFASTDMTEYTQQDRTVILGFAMKIAKAVKAAELEG